MTARALDENLQNVAARLATGTTEASAQLHYMLAMGAVGRVVQVGLSNAARYLGDNGVFVKVGGTVFQQLPRQELLRGISSKFFNFVFPTHIPFTTSLKNAGACLVAGRCI